MNKKDFIAAKTAELIEAAKNVKGFQSEDVIQNQTSLGNGLKKYYLQTGILVKGPKQGKKHTYKFDVFSINIAKVTEVYKLKEQDARPKQFIRFVEKDPVVKTETSSEPEKKNSIENLFPSVEDCKKYLQHLYGANAKVTITIVI